MYHIIEAMKRKKPLRYHLEIQEYKGNYAGLIRTSFRDQGKLKHTSHGRLDRYDPR
jgi:hypothetical protein